MNLTGGFGFTEEAIARIGRKSNCVVGVKLRGICDVVVCDKFGRIKEVDRGSHNIVVNVGLQYALDNGIAGGTWYLGLTAASPSPAAGDTMASHAGWTEFTDYDEATRQAWTEVRSSQTVSNTASPSVYTCDTNSSSVGGAFITTDDTVGGSSGTLLCAVAFSGGNKALDDDDTITVTYEITAADDGA